MIVNFSVQNFRSIKDKVTLSFEPSKVEDLGDYYIIEPKEGIKILKLGLIFGPNASGKTTILKALDFLKQIVLSPISKKTGTFDYNPFLFDKKSKENSSILTLEFIQNQVKYLYEVELVKSNIISEVLYFYNPNKALVYKRKTDVVKQLTKIVFGSKIKINKEHKATLEANTLWNNTVLGGFLKTNFESKELSEVVNWFHVKLRDLITPKTDLLGYVSHRLETNEINKSHIVDFLKKADFKISDILIENNEKVVDKDFIEYLSKRISMSDEELNKIKESGKIESKEIIFKHIVKNGNTQDNYELNYADESEGTQRYYQFSGVLDLMINKEMIFSIDELESSLHPDLLKHFLLTFLANTKQSQLIATTHHRELLMEKDILRNDIIWFTEKRDNGSTDLFSLVDFDSSVVRNTSSIFNAYKIGKLGAAPNLGDFYFESDEKK